MGAGVSITQPVLPPLVRTRFPDRVGFTTAVYTNGLLVGEILAVSLTVPLVLPLVGNQWELGLAVWAVPVLATALLVLAYGRRLAPNDHPATQLKLWSPIGRTRSSGGLGFCSAARTPSLRRERVLPDFLSAAGHPELIEKTLTALNLSQLPASFLMLGLAGRLVTRRWAYVATASLSVLGVVDQSHEGTAIVFVGVLGFSCAVTLVLALALKPRRGHAPRRRAGGDRRAADQGLKQHDRWLLARTLLLRRLDGRRSTSRLPELIEYVLAAAASRPA